MSQEVVDKIEKIIRHINNVRENCELLGTRLITKGEVDLGRKLIANGFIHDNSKFSGIEFDYLDSEDNIKQELAISHHNHTNLHHPEAWGGIKNMPRLYVAEMVCDICARSSEFGTDVRVWINEVALKKYAFAKNSTQYKEVMYFVNLLCDKPFKQIK